MTTSIEFSGLAQLLADKIGMPQPVLIALTIGLILGWICWRTRSTHVVITRIWRLVYGKTALADREIGIFIENRSRLVTFRFFSGIPVRTLPQAKRLIHWSAVHDEEIADIRACGDLFDLEACRLREERIPPRPLQLFQLILLITLAGTVVLSGYGLHTDQALLQFKESKKWFWLSDTAAAPLTGKSAVSVKDCPADTPPHSNSTSFSDDEVSVVCKALRDADTHTFIEQNVAQQRLLFGTLGAVVIACAWQCWLSFRRGYFARDMKQRINAKLKRPMEQADAPAASEAQSATTRSPKGTRFRENVDATVST